MVKVAFYGEAGSFSEESAMGYFGKKARLLSCKSFSEIFETMKNSAAYGVIPVENSIGGAVSQAYDLITASGFAVVGEIKKRISHSLIANPATRINDVKYVYSHPQALDQCREYIEKTGLIAISFQDTAGSVKMLKEKGLMDSAAIASERAARIYGMKILKNHLETNNHNYTRFFVIGKKRIVPKGRCKTSIMFITKHASGSLYWALGCMKDNGINMTYIQSRPVIGKAWEYSFFVDFEGGSLDPNVKKMLRELKAFTYKIRILGSYRAAAEPS